MKTENQENSHTLEPQFVFLLSKCEYKLDYKFYIFAVIYNKWLLE